MRAISWRLIVFLTLLHLGPRVPAAGADDAPSQAPAPPTAASAAEEVLAARRLSDGARLATLAALDTPDPWRVADELVGRGELEAAAAFGAAAPRKDVETLVAYVSGRRGRPADAAPRAALAKAEAALAARDASAALAALEGAATPDGGLVAARLRHARGSVLRALQRPAESGQAFLEAAAEAGRIGWFNQQCLSLHEAGETALRNADFSAAIDRWTQQRAVLAARGAAPWAVGRVLLNIGSAQRSLGNSEQALTTYEGALLLLEGTTDRTGIASAHMSIGTAHWALGRMTKAQQSYDRALRLQQEIPPDRLGAARTLTNMGLVQRALGNLAKAVQYYKQSIREKDDLNDTAGSARTLFNLATAYQFMGQYAQALEGFEQAMKRFVRLQDRLGTALALANIGFLYESLGAYGKALEYHTNARALQEALQDKRALANTWVNIGNVHRQLGEMREALVDAKRSLDLRREMGDRAGEAESLASIGLDHAALGDVPQALDHGERALKIYEDLKDRAGIATTLVAVALARTAAGDREGGLAAAGRAVREATQMRADSILVDALRCHATLLLAAKDPVRALAAARTGAGLFEHLYGGLTEEQGSGARERSSELFEVGVLAAQATGETAEASWFLESGRAGALLESLGNQQALRWEALPPELRVAETEARQAEAISAAAFVQALQRGTPQDIKEAGRVAAEARRRVQEVEGLIQRGSKKEASVFYPRAALLEEIQGRLEAGDALVLYGFCLDRALALVVTPQGARLVALGTAADVRAACEALELDAPGGDPAAPLKVLAKAVIAPLQLGTEVTRVLVSPEGPLSYTPFAALLEGRTVCSVPSGTTYGVLLDEPHEQGRGVLAVGDPDYGAPTQEGLGAPGRIGAGRLPRLPATRDEALLVGDKVLLDRGASEVGVRAALAEKAGRWRAVHFACHGLVDPEKPTLSSLALAPDPENNGYLTALDVFRMQIPADLVVLSACETGKGRIVKGEGIVGLTRAFMFAGAPRVICSLWKVDDAATRTLMTAFYDLWNPKDGTPGLSAAEALRRAQESVRKNPKWAHPYYWAAWVLWGLPG